MIRAGKLRTRVQIQARSTTPDAAGEPADTWTDYATPYVSIEPLQGREFFASQARGGKVQTRFRMRYIDGVTPSMRILWRINLLPEVYRVFDITDVLLVNGIKHEMIVMADELVERTV